MVSGGAFTAITWLGNRLLSKSAKENLTLWLWGEYESTWTRQFCTLFDAVFGERHLSWRCFWRSSLVSVTAVMVLYVLFSQILGVISIRADDKLPLWQVLLVGAAINIVPDYLSLFETRWLLKKFENVQSFWGQLMVLIADAIFSGAIIWGSISLFRVLHGDAPLSVVEVIAAFSIYALFFYSTFVTSLWAWLYCLSTWLMRIFSRSYLKDLMNTEHEPVTQVTFVSSVIIFVVSLTLTPALSTAEGESVTKFDRWLCTDVSDEICKHVIRLTPDEKHDLKILTQACEGGGVEHCSTLAVQYFKGDKLKAFKLWNKACEGGNMEGCANLGFMYKKGLGVKSDLNKAWALYSKACDNGMVVGCYNLGIMYKLGTVVERDAAKAVALFRRACNNRVIEGCNNLGLMYGSGMGVKQDSDKAHTLFRQACNAGLMESCANYRFMQKDDAVVGHTVDTAVAFSHKSCADGDMPACFSLGVMFNTGTGIEQDIPKAAALFKQACDGGIDYACNMLKDSTANN